MNARPNIPDYQHAANRELLASLRAQGYEIKYGPQGYRVARGSHFIAAAGTQTRPHGRYSEADTRDNLQTALTVALRHAGSQHTAATV